MLVGRHLLPRKPPGRAASQSLEVSMWRPDVGHLSTGRIGLTDVAGEEPQDALGGAP